MILLIVFSQPREVDGPAALVTVDDKVRALGEVSGKCFFGIVGLVEAAAEVMERTKRELLLVQ